MVLLDLIKELQEIRNLPFQDKANALLALILAGKGREIYQDYKWEQKKEKEERL